MSNPTTLSFGKIILICFLGFILLTFIRNRSFSIFERTESTTLTDGKSSAKTYQELDQEEKKAFRKTTQKKLKEKSSSYAQSDEVLGELARSFSKGRTKSTQEMKDLGLSEDEINYYKTVRREKSLSDKVQDAKAWFNILSTSASTYGKVKSFVNDLGGTNGEEVNESSDDFYKKLESTFGISEKEAKAFSSLGKKKVSDWAKFIDEKSN